LYMAAWDKKKNNPKSQILYMAAWDKKKNNPKSQILTKFCFYHACCLKIDIITQKDQKGKFTNYWQ
jgi:hypothetical protein